jgi:hypothetical protein
MARMKPETMIQINLSQETVNLLRRIADALEAQNKVNTVNQTIASRRRRLAEDGYDDPEDRG